MAAQSLLFLPDISGFTEFVQNTEKEHSQHVISELLEVLINSNILKLQLAEIEGDALFYYKEELPSLESLLAQVEAMFTAFYSHLKLLEKNRVCPCNACSSAVNLQLKIIAHNGELQFINVQNKKKPFGTQVIEAHRLMKNSIKSDNYFLLSKSLADNLLLTKNYQSKLFDYSEGDNEYDGQKINYLYSSIDASKLILKSFPEARNVKINGLPTLTLEKTFPISAADLLEYITNYSYRHLWAKGVDKYEYNEIEVTRMGTEHVCVINNKHFNFTVVTKKGKPGQFIYGEQTSFFPIDNSYQFFMITPITQNSCKLEIETYLKSKSVLKKLLIYFIARKKFKEGIATSIASLHEFTKKNLS